VSGAHARRAGAPAGAVRESAQEAGAAGGAVRLAVDRLWGEGPGATWAVVTLRLEGGAGEAGELVVGVEAAWRGTPPPAEPLGATWALWEREAVECFVVGAGEEYLELELGPQGHHLALTLRGARRPTRWFLPVDYRARRAPARAGRPWEEGEPWWGEARLSAALLPPPLALSPLAPPPLLPPPPTLVADVPDAPGAPAYGLYACACWGPPSARRYATSWDLGGGAPDFHRVALAPLLTLPPPRPR